MVDSAVDARELTYAEEKFYVMCEDGRLLLIEANRRSSR